MISNQILQNTIDGLKEITRIDLCVMDTDGKTLATTFSGQVSYEEAVMAFASSPADSQVIQGCQFFKIFDEHQLEYILLANGGSDDVYMVGKLAAFQIQSLLIAYKERFDKDNFVKNLLLDNLLLVDIYNRAKKLHIDTEARRVIFIVETNHEKDNSRLDNVRGILSARTKDFITAVDEKDIIIMKQLGLTEGYPELEKAAAEFYDALKSEGEETCTGLLTVRLLMISVKYPNHIKKRSLHWMSAKYSLTRRRLSRIVHLGIGRLIYQLPIPLCKMFIREIFEGKSPDEFDEETLATINKFFENSLNVSETSRQLYIHRNTLVYRLDKLQKSTGLDLQGI